MRFFLVMAAALLLAGCGATKQTTQDDGRAADEAIRSFEKGFQPSDHDPVKLRTHDRTHQRTDSSGTAIDAGSANPALSETVQGFRVQVFSTTEFDKARAKKAEFEAAFPDEWFYQTYQAPTYKLRAGNFLTRFEAERFARLLTDQGYREAWTVPETVFRTPGKRPATPPPAEGIKN
jgi:hypothetical protein